ncbi:MAG: DUF3300 domain-containing protein [Deltaproteobacteria bacterium]|nr:DUF3300 domain-containing protein [Deltaproteobacteria bacterium]
MDRPTLHRPALVGLLVLLMALPPGIPAQTPGVNPAFSQAELDQILAPIALYPDALLAQILMAATYPLEVVQADRWVRRNKHLRGERLNAALDAVDWDLSVKALVPFPQVLAMMSEKLDWTQMLGDAFLAQPEQVMDTVQSLRYKAYAQGNLQTTPEQMVIVREKTVIIEPANPTLVYVPTYNPAVVYGSWWWPAYPPYVYYPLGTAVTAGILGFTAGVLVGSAWNRGWGYWDWRDRTVYTTFNRNININRNINVSNLQTGRWRHDAYHRRGVAYRDATTRERYGGGGVGSVENRRNFRGYSREEAAPALKDPGRQQGGTRLDRGPSQGLFPGTVPRPRNDSVRQGQQPRQGIQQDRSPGALQDVGRGRETRLQSDRGRTSREFSSSGPRHRSIAPVRSSVGGGGSFRGGRGESRSGFQGGSRSGGADRSTGGRGGGNRR